MDTFSKTKSRCNIIRAKVEAGSFRVALEIMSKMGHNAFIRFKPEGFNIAVFPSVVVAKKSKPEATAQQQQSLAEYTFKGELLCRYSYRVSSGGLALPKYETMVSLQAFLSRISDAKKDNAGFGFKLRISDDGTTDSGIEINSQGSAGNKYVPTTPVSEGSQYPAVDKFSKWHVGKNPKSKIPPRVMQAVLANAKKSDSNKVEFRLYATTGNAYFSCWAPGTDKAVHTEPLDADASNSEYEDDDTATGKGYTKREIILKQSNWIHKVPRLSNSVIQVHLDANDVECPLIFSTLIGSQGTARYYMPNVGN